MAVTFSQVLLLTAALWVCAADGNPVHSMKGDLCRRLNGRKYYLEADTQAVITATNVTLPAFPRVATQTGKSSGAYQHSIRRHRREGPQEIGLIETRFRLNITSVSLSSLTSDMMSQKVFVPTPETTRILTPLSTPSLETPPSPPPPSPSEPPTTSAPILMDEPEEDMEADTDVSTAISQPAKCGVEIISRPDCHLELSFDKVNLPSCSHDKSCRCDYLRLREPPYRGVGGLDVCSSGDDTPGTFTSQTKEVRLDFLYTRAYEDAFTVSIIAKRNKYRVMGKVNNTVGYIRSPFFPELYPREHWMEYELVSKEENARIAVTFLDFQLSPWSFVEIQDTNKTRLAVFNGNLFRPPVLVSSGSHITVRFSGNGETARGFNLQYAFIDAASNAVIPPITDCGGYVTNFGGTITMMNMSQDEINYTMYDCVWIVQPPQNYAFKSHLSIKVVQFEEMAPGTALEIRQGVTSDDYLLERIEGGDAKTSQEHVVAVDTGFYVRLRGFFNKSSKLAIVYTSFSYLGSCYSMTDLMCHNHRCIPKMLRCDGFDHCGDNSDEPPTCYIGAGNKGLTPEDAAWWYQHTPNYYFPQKSSFLGGPHGWSGVLLLTSLIVMVLLIIGLISYLFRHGPDRRMMRERRGHNGIHSRRGSITDDVEVIDASADDPPIYEPPPDYEEVIKVILSGNNLKLVRRPGGVTAWVPDKLAEGGNDSSQPINDRPLRTRHASLDLEHGMEVVLWNSNSSVTPSSNVNNTATASNETESSTVNTPNVPFRMGHIRRSSLPTAPSTEAMQTNVQGHSVSVAPETIPEALEAMDSPRPPISHIHSLSSPPISLQSFHYDTSAVSTPGPSTPHLGRISPKRRKSRKVSKKGGKRKKSSTTRKPELQNARDDSAPPSYEDVMQQVIHSEVRSPTPATEAHSGIESANHVNESTQTSIDAGIPPDTEDLSPTDRVQAAREMFQRLSKGDQKPAQVSSEVNGSHHIARRPAVQVNKTKHQKSTSSGGTISRGTVKSRKAMLLKAQKQRRDCDCNGACSCAHFKPDSPSEETPFAGGVKSKVKYYLTIEESTKIMDNHSFRVPSPCANEPQESQQKLENPETSNAAHKRRKLVRNQSAPTISRIRDRDLEIYFSQTEETQGITMPSPTEDMERPLITPVTDSPKPIFIVPQNTVNMEEITDHEGTPSIQKRVKLYNDLAKSKSPSPLPPQTPSPLRSSIQGIKFSKILRIDSIESVDASDNTGIMCMRSIKSSASDAHIKPGIVKEATAKFITTLAADICPKFNHQDSDDWNGDCDSPLPVRIPYLNLRNEASSSPDICDNEPPFLQPLKKEEAESIELWDSISQGRCEDKENSENSSSEDVTKQFPAASSGAVPKKSVEVTINLSKKKKLKSQKENATQTEQHQCTHEYDMELRNALKLNLKDTFSPASDAEMTDCETPDKKQDFSHQSKQLVLEEINLGPKNLCYQSSSDDDSLPPTSHSRRNLDETLNKTLDSDIDGDGFPRALLASGCSTVSPKHTQEVKTLRKFPVPSPRGSKAAQAKLCRKVENLNTTHPSSDGHVDEGKTKEVSSPVLIGSTSSSLSDSSEASSPNPPTPRSLMTPTLSPQMESSGIVTINTSKRLRWDYI